MYGVGCFVLLVGCFYLFGWLFKLVDGWCYGLWCWLDVGVVWSGFVLLVYDFRVGIVCFVVVLVGWVFYWVFLFVLLGV